MLNIFTTPSKKTTATELLSAQMENAKSRKYGWNRAVKSQLSENEKQALIVTLDNLNDEDAYKSLTNKLNQQPLTKHSDLIFKELSESLRIDIKGYTDKHLHKTLKKIEIGFLPTGAFDAYCINQDINQQVIDGYVICLSQGLYFSLQLLLKSLVLENLDGELSQYKQSGEVSYNYAINLFFDPTFTFDNELFFNGLSTKIQGELASYQHNLSTIILKFIALHEFAHIINNDLDILKTNKVQYFSNEALNTELDSNQHWQAELKADEFALNCICHESMSPVGIWANFSQIYLFLLFLSDIERTKNHKLSSTHPPSKFRANHLLKIMIEKFPQTEDAKNNIDWIEKAVQRWGG